MKILFPLALACAALAAPLAAETPVGQRIAITAEPLKGVHHIGITVSDIDATLAFYRKSVAMEVVERRFYPASSFPAGLVRNRRGRIEIATVRTPTVYLELTDFAPERSATPEQRSAIGPGYTHICWQTPATAPGYDRFKAAGLKMLSRGDKPVDIGGYGVTYAYGFDPDGTMIEMEQVERPRRTDPAWVTHLANVPGDLDAMLKFYQGVIGYEPYRQMAQSNRPKLDDIVDVDGIAIRGGWFALRNLELEFWHYDKPATALRRTPQLLDRIGYNQLAFEVTDLGREIIRLRGLGVKLVGRPVIRGGWLIQYARDPEGNVIAFQQNLGAGPVQSIDAMRWLDPASYLKRFG